MSNSKYDEILSRVEKPSRYLGTETNSIRKDPKGVKLRFALAFPDQYEIGTSHFGIQILYHVLNRRPDIAAERVFAPGVDMENLLRAEQMPLTSLESRRPLSAFDIVGFSLLYELNYTNILTLLDLAGLAFAAEHRTADQPLVVAGGPCACNPEPVAGLFDAVVVGDGERAILEMSDAWLAWKADGDGDKSALLRSWAALEGVYVPSLFRVTYGADGLARSAPAGGVRSPVRRAVVEDLDEVPFPSQPVVPFGRPVHDRLRMEISRGCSRGCRFCQAGMIYRPVRERSCGRILDLVDAALQNTGYEDLSLLSLSTGDYSSLPHLISRLMDRCTPERIAVSLPSFRAGTLTSGMMRRIRQVRKTGFTIAPEAGSQRLREVINKNLTDQEIEKTVSDAFAMGWQVIKLYFMIGLPTETEEDHEAMVDLVLRLRALRKKSGRRGQINVSVTTFIPKPHTPFQWAGQISVGRSKQILDKLRSRMAVSGVRFKWQDPEVSYLEGLWARGDRRLTPLLAAAWQMGCRFDGWSDHFRPDRWRRAIEAVGIDPDFFTTRRRGLEEPLPWDHIDMGISRRYLEDEWEKARLRRHTPDCRWGECNDCGVCDFRRVRPLVGPVRQDEGAEAPAPASEQADGAWLRIDYQKAGRARYFGHLEMVSLFFRAMRRAGVPVAYSKGYHPKPRMVFDQPLPVGIESEREVFDVLLAGQVDPAAMVQGINAALPEGLCVLAARLLPGKTPIPKTDRACYRVDLAGAVFDPQRLESFSAAGERVVSHRSGKGSLKNIDLTAMVLSIELTGPSSARMTLRSEPGRMLRPEAVMDHIFGLGVDEIRRSRIVKQEAAACRAPTASIGGGQAPTAH